MAAYTWSTSGGSFNSGGNWAPSGPPGPSDTALFNSNGGTITGTGAVSALNLSGAGPWVFNAGITSNDFTVNDDTTVSGPGVWTLTGSASGGNSVSVANGANTTGSLTVSAGGTINSTQAANTSATALAVAAFVGATGTVTITGAGSQLMANGSAMIGTLQLGRPFGSGVGTVTVANGGTLAVSGALVIVGGSRLTVDQSSTLSAPAITILGGLADLYTLPSTNVTFVTGVIGGTLRVHALSGASTVSNFSDFNTIDLAGTTAVALSGNTVSTATGSLNLGAAPVDTSYRLESDGSGGTLVALQPQTIGVYRFFDTTSGTHFYTADANEAATVRTTRPDLTPEGIGFQALAGEFNDRNAAPVYRFFDTVHGTHFYTASPSEWEQVIASRPDLTYEPGSTTFEHTTQQPGDVPVYRFFDNVYGTHFYTDSATEFANVQSTRPDLVYEGVGFYEPPQNYATATT